MKRLLYLFFSIISIVALQSCDDRDDIRADIDSLNARLDALEPLIEQYNTDIANFQDILNGKILVVGYSELAEGENVYGYTVELSNGETITVYNGEPDETLPVMSIGEDGNWYYTQYDMTYPLLDEAGDPVSAAPEAGKTPQIRVNAEGEWEYSWDGVTWIGNIGIANPDLAQAGTSIFDDVKVEGDNMIFTWTNGESRLSKSVPMYAGLQLDIDHGSESPVVFGLGQTRVFKVTQSDEIVEAVIETKGWGVRLDETQLTVTAPPTNTRGTEYEDRIVIKIFSEEGYCRAVTLPVKLLTTSIDENSATAWQNFLSGGTLLPDFSYAGYMHGEVAPPDVMIDFSAKLSDASGNPYYNATLAGGAQGSATYKVYDVTDYGAVPNDGISDRPALFKILKEAMKCTEKYEDSNKTLRYYLGGGSLANAVIYFPEGTFLLRGGAEDETVETIRLTMGNLVLKGAGADKTVIEMGVENNPANSDLWSTPNLLEVKHNSGLENLSDVTGDAVKGSFSVRVSTTSGIAVGDWVCLTLVNNDPTLIAEELAPHSITPQMTDLRDKGVQIYDMHQVKSISGNTVEFVEPLMHEVKAQYGWKIQKYPHYENVGVEDLKFLGHSKEDFRHHGSASDDGGFKPINLIRLTNSWMRRVDFESVSEAASIVSCANISAYTVHISGNRGHASVRSQASSRVFIGNVTDTSSGKRAVDSGGQQLGEYIEGAGQYHGCGVSKESMGAVIWNVQWGNDACFESHASQPRATLIDRCRGAFIPWREGGDEVQLPNHLNDLVIWNMNATKTGYDGGWGNKFIWWDNNNRWWKNMPPVIVGFHGASIVFDESPEQVKYMESLGMPVEPQSLYEAQLERRLGYVPAWLNALK